MASRKLLEKIRYIGQPGVIQDIAPSLLTSGAVTSCLNVNFRNATISSRRGWNELLRFPIHDDPPIISEDSGDDVEFLIPYPTQTAIFLLFCTTKKTYVFNGTIWSDITGEDDWSGTLLEKFDGAIGGSVLILNNGLDAPRYWNQPTGGGILTTLPWDVNDSISWDDKSAYCQAIRPFRNHWMALNVVELGETFASRVMWSNPAEPDTVPMTWVYDDPANDAGFLDLLDTPGVIRDGLALNDSFLIYKDRSLYKLTYTGDNFIFRSQMVSAQAGIMGKNCVVPFGNEHLVLSLDDIYRTDGNNVVSVIDKRIRRSVFNTISTDAFDKSFLVNYRERKEIWVCVPQQGDEYPTIAYIWNYNDDTWTMHSIPESRMMVAGPLLGGGTAWDEMVGQWDESNEVWGGASTSQLNEVLLSAAPATEDADSRILMGDVGISDEGDKYQIHLTRENLGFGTEGHQTTVVALYPHVQGNGTLNFYIGAQESALGSTSWRGPYSYTIGQDKKITCRVTGQFISLRVECDSDTRFELSGIDVEYRVKGTTRSNK